MAVRFKTFKAKVLDPSLIPIKERAQHNFWAILLQTTQALLILAVVGAIAIYFLPVIRKFQNLQDQRAKSGREINSAIELNKQLQREVELLKTNPDYLERQARDRLQVARPNETIFRFDSYQENK